MTGNASTRTRIALIGCGEVAIAAHLPALVLLHDAGELELVGVCDLDATRAEQAALHFGVGVWGTDWAIVARDARAHAVAVCTLPGPNAEISIAALAAGLHVLCEKPPGRGVGQAERMAAAAAARPDLVTMVALNRRYAPLVQRARERSMALGSPHSFAARFTRAALGREPSNAADDWVTSDGSHALDLAIATIGVPHQVIAASRSVGAGPDNSWVIQLMSEHAHATLWLDFAAGRRLERFEWAGPGYDVALELPDHATWSAPGGTESWQGTTLSGSADIAVNYGFRDEYRAFIAAIAGTAPRPDTDFAYGALLMRVIAQILAAKSGETRSIVAVPSAPQTARTNPAPPMPARVHARPVVAVLQPPAALHRYFAPAALAELASVCDLRLPTERDPFAAVPNADAIMLGWSAPALPASVLAAGDRLRLAIVLGASVRHALPAEAFEPGRLVVRNTADAIARSVAEHCLLLTLAGLRRLTEVDAAMHAGEWPKPRTQRTALRKLAARIARVPLLQPATRRFKPAAALVLTRLDGDVRTAVWSDLRGQTVGLVGWGHIARCFAELLQPFDCTLLVASDHVGDDDLRRFGARRASLGEVLAAARVVSLHKTLNQRNRGLIGRELLASLSPGAVLVNTARAGIIDASALLERARRGDVVCALDVFDLEPLPRRHPLRNLRNVILTPHSASATPECARRVGDQALAVLRAWVSGADDAAVRSGVILGESV